MVVRSNHSQPSQVTLPPEAVKPAESLLEADIDRRRRFEDYLM